MWKRTSRTGRRANVCPVGPSSTPPYFHTGAALALLLLLATATAAQVSRFSAEGHTRDELRELDGVAVGGLTYCPGKVGQAFHFDGREAAVRVPDHEALRFTESLTLSAWVKAEAYPGRDQDYGQVIFRGDDRGGMDPYFLGLNPEGQMVFGVDSGSEYVDVRAPFPLDRFIHVTATLDHATGCMRLLYGDRVVAQTTTRVRPLRDLDPAANPGIGIGNHASRPSSIWSQPFTGVIDEVTLSGETLLVPKTLTVDRTADGEYVARVTLATPAPPDGARVRVEVMGIPYPMFKSLDIEPGDRTGAVVLRVPDEKGLTVTARYNGVTKSARVEE